jgi:hypothetical protein
LLKNAPPHDTFRCVEPQHAGRHGTNRIDRLDDSAIQPEMIFPSALPGIEQRKQIARGGHGRYVRTFISIADHAGKGKIVRTRLAAMLSAYNVIDLMGKGTVIFMKQAIFASEHRPLHYFGA